MEWYFGFSADGHPICSQLAQVAVATARDRTNLEPHLIFDGPESDPRLDWFARRGVTIHHHRSRLSETIENLYRPHGAAARGAYLRVDVPLLTEAPFALYTDCDVMFLGGVSELESLRPSLFAAAPEKHAADRSYFNSGVMLLNVAAMRASYGAFASYLALAPRDDLWAFDQGPLNAFYREHDWLEPRWNWKSYWRQEPGAKIGIVHFHGAKPGPLIASSGCVHAAPWIDLWADAAARCGVSPDLTVPSDFDEVRYVAMHPDVAAAVKSGEQPSGLYHYLTYGRAEGRATDA